VKSKGKGKGAHTSTEKKNNGRIHGATKRFHLKLKHLLAGVSFISLFTAFEVMSVPVASGMIVLFTLTRSGAAAVWFLTALFTGSFAYELHHREEKVKV
jgi:hypothetical protein